MGLTEWLPGNKGSSWKLEETGFISSVKIKRSKIKGKKVEGLETKSQKMWRQQIRQRLDAAVEEIMGIFERAATGYEQEQLLLDETTEQWYNRLQHLVSNFNNQLDVQQLVLIPEDAPEEQMPGVDQQNLEPLHINEEEQEVCTSQGEEQLNVKETDPTRFPSTAVPLKSDDDEEKPLFSHLHQHRVEDGDLPTSSSADQMETMTDGEGGGRTRTIVTPHPNTYKDNSSSSETEDSNDYDKEDIYLPTNSSADQMETGTCGEDSGGVCKKVQTLQKSFTCNNCGKRFIKKSHLDTHMRIHTGEKPFACDLCGQRFRHKTTLKAHVRIHTGEKPFACDLCGQRFRQKTHLNTHMRIHTEEKPFACDLCGQRFRQKTHLNTHMRIHTEEKPFACDLCGQRFCQKQHLNKHMRIHTEQKLFACEICEHRFCQKTSLNKHMRTHTGGRTVQM